MRSTIGRSTTSSASTADHAEQRRLRQPQQIRLVQTDAQQAAVFRHRDRIRAGKAQANDLDMVATLLIETDRALHQTG